MMSISETLREKSRKLLKNGKVRKDMDSEKRLFFTVDGESESYSVIFDRDKGTWSCECKYSSMKNKECSHIHACKLLIKQGI